MRALFFCVTIALVGPVFGSDPDADRTRKQLRSDNYSVTWGTGRTFDPSAELEIGYGNGHGFTLGWMLYQPGQDGVNVLCIQFDGGRHPYMSKWPPDSASVTVKKARMKPEAYAGLLRDLAVVDAAKLEPIAMMIATRNPIYLIGPPELVCFW